MLKPLVKRGLFLALKNGDVGLWGEFHPLGINLPPKHVFGCREHPANPYWVSWRSVQGTKKRKKKSTLGLNISPPPPNDPPLHTLFVLCVWGGVTDVITHAKFHLNGSAVSAPQGVEFHHFP